MGVLKPFIIGLIVWIVSLCLHVHRQASTECQYSVSYLCYFNDHGSTYILSSRNINLFMFNRNLYVSK